MILKRLSFVGMSINIWPGQSNYMGQHGMLPWACYVYIFPRHSHCIFDAFREIAVYTKRSKHILQVNYPFNFWLAVHDRGVLIMGLKCGITQKGIYLHDTDLMSNIYSKICDWNLYRYTILPTYGFKSFRGTHYFQWMTEWNCLAYGMRSSAPLLEFPVGSSL